MHLNHVAGHLCVCAGERCGARLVPPSLFAVVNPRAAAGGGVCRDSGAVCPLFAILCQGGIMQAESGARARQSEAERRRAGRGGGLSLRGGGLHEAMAARVKMEAG